LVASGTYRSLLILYSHLSRLIVKDLDATRYLSGKLYEILVGRVFVYVVVAVFFVLKLNYEAMC
jgi:hypothetical protein